MRLYIRYENAYPYLPIAIGCSVQELSEQTGASINTIRSAISHKAKTFAVVEIEEDK